MATTSACAVGSLHDVTWFQPSAMIVSLRTITAPNGPPPSSRIFSSASAIARCMKAFSVMIAVPAPTDRARLGGRERGKSAQRSSASRPSCTTMRPSTMTIATSEPRAACTRLVSDRLGDARAADESRRAAPARGRPCRPGAIGADGKIERRRAARGRHVEDFARRQEARIAAPRPCAAARRTSSRRTGRAGCWPWRRRSPGHVDAAPAHVGDGRDAGSELEIGVRAMRHMRACGCEQRAIVLRHPDAMGQQGALGRARRARASGATGVRPTRDRVRSTENLVSEQ